MRSLDSWDVVAFDSSHWWHFCSENCGQLNVLFTNASHARSILSVAECSTRFIDKFAICNSLFGSSEAIKLHAPRRSNTSNLRSHDYIPCMTYSQHCYHHRTTVCICKICLPTVLCTVTEKMRWNNSKLYGHDSDVFRNKMDQLPANMSREWFLCVWYRAALKYLSHSTFPVSVMWHR